MLCHSWRRRGGGATTEVIQAFLPNRFTDSNTKQSLDLHWSRRGSGLHYSGEGGQRGFLEERLLKLGFEDSSSAEKGIQEVLTMAGRCTQLRKLFSTSLSLPGVGGTSSPRQGGQGSGLLAWVGGGRWGPACPHPFTWSMSLPGQSPFQPS